MTVLTTSLRACALSTYLHASCEKPPGRSNVTCYQITLCLTAAKHHFYQEFWLGVSRGTSAFYRESSSLEMTVLTTSLRACAIGTYLVLPARSPAVGAMLRVIKLRFA